MRPWAAGAVALGILALARAGPAAGIPAAEAPFGLAWGPIAEVPRPFKADREANLTALYYPRGWPPALGAATAAVVLVVCRDEGLQQVVWVGLPLSGEVLAGTRRAIHDEGVRRYGEPDASAMGAAEVWSGGQVLLDSREASGGRRELVMTALGPGYAACSERHRAETGHPAGAHVTELIGTGDP